MGAGDSFMKDAFRAENKLKTNEKEIDKNPGL